MKFSATPAVITAGYDTLKGFCAGYTKLNVEAVPVEAFPALSKAFGVTVYEPPFTQHEV